MSYADRVAACRHHVGGRLYNGLNVQIGNVCGRCLQPLPLGPSNDRDVPRDELELAEHLASVCDSWASERYSDAHARFWAAQFATRRRKR